MRKSTEKYSPGSVSVMSASCVLVLIATTVLATPEFINTVPSTNRVSSACRSLHMADKREERKEEKERRKEVKEGRKRDGKEWEG